MATLELSQTSPHDSSSGAANPARPRPDDIRAARLLGGAVLVILTYAVFAHGSVAAPAQPRVEVALAFVASCAAVAWLWTSSLRLRAPRAGWTGLALLAVFGGWTGASLAWSVAPDLTWTEFNQTLAYVLALLLGIALGASARDAIDWAVRALLGLVTLVTAYALLQKLLPGIHIGGVLNLDQTAVLARLQEPIGYWNALALLLAMGAPAALVMAARRDGSRALRVGSLLALQLMTVAEAFTVSRGGIVAFAVALLACVALSGSRLRVLMWATCPVVAALPAVVIGLTSHALSGDGVGLAPRETAGVFLLLLLIGTGALLTLGARRMFVLESTVELDVARRRRIGNLLVGAVLTILVILLLGVTASNRGLTGTISHIWDSFTSTKAVSVSSPSRLLTDASGNRWTWWKEALGAFSARPLLGWGAGSFPVVHLLFRHNTISVDHAHSAFFQWLAEDGLIGTCAVLAGWALLVRCAARAVLRRRDDERLMASALLAAIIAYSLHALYDWDWDILGVTLPVLIALGALIGSDGLRRPAPGEMVVGSRGGPSSLRLGGVALIAIGCCAYALSAALPSVAAGRASAAEVAAAGASGASLRQASRDAALATRLDPLSDLGPRAAADVAIRRGQLGLARALLTEATDREPSDVAAWLALAGLDAAMRRPVAAIAAARNAVEADPESRPDRRELAALVGYETLQATPPADSVTAGP